MKSLKLGLKIGYHRQKISFVNGHGALYIQEFDLLAFPRPIPTGFTISEGAVPGDLRMSSSAIRHRYCAYHSFLRED